MNKVTSYLKNVGKSITYATVDFSTKTLIPEVHEFTQTNEDLFKAVYATVAHPKKSMRYGTKYVKNSQVYKDIYAGVGNVFDDIKTGNFYNKARADASIDATGTALAFGDDDFGEDFDFGDWDDDGSFGDFDDDDNESTITEGDKLVTDAVVQSGNLSAQLISKTVANTSNNSIKAGLANTKMMMSQNVELVAGIRTSIAGVHESINSILKFSEQAVVPHFNTQSQFFSDSINIMKENNAILKEMREMQKNIYDKQMEEFKSKNQFSDVFGGGTLDLTEYTKAVWKNTKNYVDKTGMLGMMGSSLGGTSMLGQMLSNPLGGATMALVQSYIPKTFAKQVASFSKTLGNAFPAMIGRLNKWKKDDDGSIRSFLGNIFGLSNDNKTTIDTSKYNKEAVPFDGITRKAIVDIIPEHLSKIESILSGSSQRIYNFETGKWMSTKDIEKAKKNDYNNAVNSGFSSINDEIKTFMDTLTVKAETKREFEQKIQSLKEEIFKGDKLLSPENIIKDAGDYDPLMKEFGVMLSKIPVSKLSEVYANIYDSKTNYSRKMASAEAKGDSILRKLYDDSNTNSHLKYDETFKDYVVGNKSGINLLNAKDEYGFNVLDYLNQILANVSFIREFGGSGGRKDSKIDKILVNEYGQAIGTGKKSNNYTKFDDYAKNFKKEYTPEELSKLRKKQQEDDERYDRYHYKEEIDPEVTAWDARAKVQRKARFSNLDDDEFKKFGKRYKEKNHWMKEMEDIPGDTFHQKWVNAQSMKQKEILIMGSLSDIARKPASMLTGLMSKAEDSVYNFLFKAETDMFDDEGHDVKGFFQAILEKMKASWDQLTTTIDEKFISPLVKKYGLDEKWEKLKEKVKNTKPAQFVKNAAENVKSAVFKDLGGIYNYTKDSFEEVLDPFVYNDAMSGFHYTRKKAIAKKVIKGRVSRKGKISDLKEKLTDEQKEKLSKRFTDEQKRRLGKLGFASGGKSIVTESGVVPVSEGEIIEVDTNGTNPKSNEEAEIDKIYEYLLSIINKDKDAFSSGIAKTQKINDKLEANKGKLPFINDILTGTKEEFNNVSNITKKAVGSVIGIEGDTDEERESNLNAQKKKLSEKIGSIFGEMKGEGANTASKMIIGGGLGLLSGVLGGPLIGAGVGAATSLIKNSETVSKAIFGEDVTDEEGNTTHKGGIISKDIQDTFKKYVPDMGKYGAVGAVASFLTPFGPLGGAAIGAGVSLMKNSTTMNEMIFGKEITNEDGSKTKKGGLLTPERLNTIKKFAPKAIVGSLGGLVLGPFGLVGNAALGAGIGMLTGTEDFKDLILGEKDSTGKRIGGIPGAMREHFIEPLKSFGTNLKNDFFDFIKESMIDPLNDAITPITHEVAFWAKKIGIGIPKFFLQLGKDYIAQPFLSKIEDYIGRPIRDGLKKVFGSLFSRAKGVISAPFRALGAIGNATRRHQLRAGTDAGGLAKDRLEFAEKQNMDDYKYKAFDEKLAENSDNTEWLEELTARTGYLAHGSEYFKKEVKKSRRELSGVLDDYVKLGWFKGANKRAYKQIKKYIDNNDIESAIAELSNITETRKGGRLDGEEANNAIARFTDANKKYQATRSARDKLKDINETENAEWMEQQFGENWRELKADRLFDYARKESLAAGGRAVGKSDLFKDPTNLITKGDETINNTLREILDAITDAKKGVFHTEEENKAYEEAAKAGKETFDIKNDIGKFNVKSKFSKFGFKDDTISVLYADKKLQDLVLGASHKGTMYDDDTVKKLATLKLSNAKRRLLKKYPNIAYMSPEEIEKNLDYVRNNHGTITNNSLFGAKAIRNRNLKKLNEQFMQNNEEETLQNQSTDDLNNESSDNKVTYIPGQYGVEKYVKGSRGGWTPDNSDSDTKEAIEKKEEDLNTRKGLLSHVSGLKDSIFGFFKRNKEKEDEEEKEPWYKKLFNSEIGSKIKFGAAILGLVTGVGAIKNLWDSSKENNGVIYRIGSAVGDTVGGYISKIGNWFTNTGEYSDTSNSGLQGLLNNHVFPNMYKGMELLMGTVIPKLIVTTIQNLPTILGSVGKGVGNLLGWDLGDDATLMPKDISSESINNSVAGQFATRSGEVMIRSALTGKTAPIFKAGKAIGVVDKGLRATVGKIPVIGNMYNTGSSLIKGVSNVFKKSSELGVQVNKNIKNGNLEKTGKKLADAASKATDNTVISKVTEFVKSGVSKILNNPIVKKSLEKALSAAGKISSSGAAKKAVIKETINTIVEKVGTTFAGKVAKKATNAVLKIGSKIAGIATGGILTAAIIVADFISGVDKAESILGIKEPTVIQTFLAGLLNVITNQIFFGFIEPSVVTDLLVDTILPAFNVDTNEFKAQQEETTKEVEEYKETTGEEITVEEYLEENNSFTGKIKKAIGKLSLREKGKELYDNTIGSITNDDKIRERLGLNADVKVNLQDRLSSGLGSIGSLFTGKDAAELTKTINGEFETVKKLAKKAGTMLNDKIGAFFGFTDENGEPLSLTEGVKAGVKNVVEDAKEGWNNLKTSVSDLKDELTTGVKNIMSKASDAVSDANKKMGALLGFTDENGEPISLTEGVKRGITEEIDQLKSYWGNLKSKATELWDKITNSVSEVFGKIADSVKSALDKVDKRLGSLLGFEDKEGNSISLTEGAKNIAEKVTTKWNGIKSFFSSIQNFFINASDESIAERNAGKGTGFVSQLDPKYKNKKFNISGDTERQTIGDSGCAPATAANVLNYFTGQGSVMDDASKAALKFKDKNGGVTPDYFNNYLGKQGIGTYSTMNKKEIISGISQGSPTILLGTDPTNKANTPYGSSSSHYVLATGVDGKGNVVIQDPESSKPNVLYPMKDVIKQSQMGIITGKGTGRNRSITSKVRSSLGKIGFGRGYTAQHEDLAKWSALSDSEIDNFIKKSNSKSPFTGKAINAAAKASGLNPRYILAHAAVESAWGTSNYGKKYHNYFGIGAFDSNPDNAINYGNSGMESGLIEGAKWIRQNYYDAGQTTVYTMRYNNGTHQYCTSDTWVDTIASIMEAMPANTSAEYHDMDTTVTGANANAATDIFSQFSNAMLSYYNEDLVNLIFGTTSEDTGSLESNSLPGGVSASGTAEAVVEVASAEVGVKADSNQNTKYHNEYGMNNCPWCVIFLWWVFKHAGCPEQFYGGAKTAAVSELLAYYRKNNQLINKNNGQPGDIVFINDFNGGSTAVHVGLIVANLGNGRYTTIEGNTDYSAGYSTGRVGKNDRLANCIVTIARPNYATSSGSGTNKKFKSMTHINPEIRYTGKGKNIAAAILSGKGTGRGVKYSTVYSTGTTTASNVLNNSRKYYSSNTTSKSINTSLNGRTTTKTSNNSLPSLKSSYGTSSYNTSRVSYLDANGGVSSTSGSGSERLLGVIIEILQIIANNSEKLSEIVSLLSKALNLELTDNDISGLSSNNAKIKNKIANALKTQGSSNGLGNSSMNATTESLAAAMYSIARA